MASRDIEAPPASPAGRRYLTVASTKATITWRVAAGSCSHAATTVPSVVMASASFWASLVECQFFRCQSAASPLCESENPLFSSAKPHEVSGFDSRRLHFLTIWAISCHRMTRSV